jgi:hypothetical protein
MVFIDSEHVIVSFVKIITMLNGTTTNDAVIKTIRISIRKALNGGAGIPWRWATEEATAARNLRPWPGRLPRRRRVLLPYAESSD